MVAAQKDGDEEIDPQTLLKIDEQLNFTYSIEMMPSVEMFGLTPNLTDPESGEDELIEIFMGTFHLNMSLMEDMPEWEEENSMRFCLQMYPALNSDGTNNTLGKGDQSS